MGKLYDVIIGGGGPVGLFLAGELALAGISVLVLEKEADMSSSWAVKPLGVRGLNTLSLDSFHRRGLLDKIFDPDDGERPFTLVNRPSPQFAGHFAGIMFDANKLDLSRWKYRLAGPSLVPCRTFLDRLLPVLSDRAQSLGVTILRGSAVTSHSQDADAVTVQAGDQVFYAKYLVGCDGGRSTIRKQAGFEFVGTDAEFTGYVASCELDDPEKLKLGFQSTPEGMYIMLEFGYVAIMDFDGGKFDRTQDVTHDHFESVLRRVSGENIKIKELHMARTFTDRARQATTYRKDRVLLAGDSAHIHSPLGGQGLNAGLGDAMNLGWKLAAVVRGTSPDNLLNSYTEERHPIGVWVTEWTRAQVTILKPNPFGMATNKIIKDLINTTDGTNYFVDCSWGLSQRYDLGEEHPLVGVSAPDFEFVDGTRLGNKMESGRGMLIDFTNNTSLLKLATIWETHVDYVTTQVKDTLGLNALIIRPDGIVAWLAEASTNLETAKSALLRWFGPIQVNSELKATIARGALHLSDIKLGAGAS